MAMQATNSSVAFLGSGEQLRLLRSLTDGAILGLLLLALRGASPGEADGVDSMNNLAGVLEKQGKYEEAEAIHRQALQQREKVLGYEHLETLESVYCLAHLLSTTHRYNESLALYKRACTGYETMFGKDHSTTHACHRHRHHASALALEQQGQRDLSSTKVNSSASVRRGIESKLQRGLVKIGTWNSRQPAR
jgi:tetratricopeptide (TPR) repeat protein